MTSIHYLNCLLYYINAILWVGYADKPFLGAVWALVGTASFWLGRNSR